MTALVEYVSETVLANEEERTITTLLLPFGEVGNTNAGRFTVEAGTLELPADPEVVGLNLDHQRNSPVGRAIRVEETAEGVMATFRIAKTPEGDAALADALNPEGKRRRMSAEFDAVIRAGRMVMGRLFGAALVEKPAFPSATVLASDIGDLPDPEGPATREEAIARAIAGINEAFDQYAAHIERALNTQTPEEAEPSEDAEETTNEPEVPADTEENTVADAVVSETLAASAPALPENISAREAFQLLAASHEGKADASRLAKLQETYTPDTQVFAAQANVPFAGGPVPYNPAPQWIGEIWDANPVKPVISDLLGSKELTSRKVSGFKFTTRPEGAEWAGNGAEIHSAPIATTPYDYTAKYWAGGNTFSREWTDFGVSDTLMQWYFEEQTRNFQLWLDQTALDGITSSAFELDADDPTGLSIGAGFSAIIDGAAQVIANTNGVVPTFALVKASLYKQMLKTPQNNVLGYLNAALGLEEGSLNGFQIRPVPDAKMGNFAVLVGARQGADIYTLPGSPVRAETLNVANGLINVGLYGYGLFVPNKADTFVGVNAFSA